MLEKKIEDLQAKIAKVQDDKIQSADRASGLREQNIEYRELILKYEEQQIIKDQELQAMQMAIKDSVANVEKANE